MRIVSVLGLICTFSCTKELDLTFPQADTQIVLNGILHPDSTIRISLTTTLPSSSTADFPIIDDAIVHLYEDDAMIGRLTFEDSAYLLDYYPRVKSEYRIEAAAPGFPTVQASDVVPDSPDVSICFRADTTDQYNYAGGILGITINDPVQEENFYWLDIVSTYPDYPRCRIEDDSVVWNESGPPSFIERDTIVCDDGKPPTFTKSRQYHYSSYSSVPDRFNSFIDNTSNEVTVYEGFIRVDDIMSNGEVISFEVAAEESYSYLIRYPRIHDQLSLVFTLTNASAHYDRYLKSSIAYYLNRQYSTDEEVGLKPFVQSSQVYSNVENGTGIFAANNSVSLDIEDYPCP